MKVLFYEPYTRHSPHFEYCLELMQKNIDKGHEVFFIGCNAEFKACDNNIFNYSAICTSCVKRCQKGISLLSKEIKLNNCTVISKEQENDVSAFLKQLSFHSLKELKSIKYDNFDLGMAVASSFISNFRNPYLDVNKIHKLIFKYLESALKAYLGIRNFVEKNKIDAIHLHNGRLAHLKPALRVAEYYNIDYYVHEVGGEISKYSLYKNMLPHNFIKRGQLIIDFWEKADKNTREELGKSFYEAQATGKVMHERYNHIKQQNRSLLPENWDSKKRNIIIFNSSEDEFAAIEDKRPVGIYSSQLEGIKAIVKEFNDNINYHIYLRVHPNLRTANPNILKAIEAIKASNFTIIAPHSPISTYKLLDEATAVITFVSTVGIEAAFRNKKAIILGYALYNNLGSTYQPQSHEETIELLNKIDTLSVLDNKGAIIYGFYRKCFGEDCKYYEPETLFKGKFKGVFLDEACSLLELNLAKMFEKIQGFRKKKNIIAQK